MPEWHLTEASAIGKWERGEFLWLNPTDPPTAPTIALGPRAHPPDAPSLADWHGLAVTPLPRHTLEPEEVYVRGDDLIARFRQSADDAYSVQLDWRLLAVEAPFAIGIELWITIQTSLLDTAPELEVACRGPRDRRWRGCDHARLTAAESDPAPAADPVAGSEAAVAGEEFGLGGERRAAAPAALWCDGGSSAAVWLIEPTDPFCVRRAALTDDGRMCLRLFGQFLEKGVIRRARMRLLLADRAPSWDAIRQAYQRLATSPLPLTA